MLRKISLVILLLCAAAGAAERQLTSSPLNHNLDNNDNFSRDDRFLCFDTRETVARGNGSSASILKVDVRNGAESIVYAPKTVQFDPVNAAPGIIATSFSPVADEIIFIHGPFVSETPTLGFYGKTNRRGAVVPAGTSGQVRFLDARDVSSDITPPGAHRGGTHRHEYSLDGLRIGFTYDDHLLTSYGRTVGMMMASPRAPAGVTHWTAILVPIVPQGTARPGELESAAFDSWIGARGLMRGFIGKVKETDGTYHNSLFVVDVPENVDITTSDSGTKTRYMAPPRGVAVRRLTHQDAWGIVRGSRDGRRIAYFANAPDGSRQVFLIDSQGSGNPVQATFLPRGARSGLRWHPSGNSIAVSSENGVAVVCVKADPLFGKSFFLTAHGPGRPMLDAMVWSNDGAVLAYNQRVPTHDANGNPVRDAAARDFQQIFLVDFPDSNHNGIADPIE